MPLRIRALAAAALLVSLTACATTTPQPSPTASSTPSASAEACATSPEAAPGDPAALVTPRALCDDDGEAWARTSMPGSLPLFAAEGSDAPACAALGGSFSVSLLDVERLLHALSAESLDDAGLPLLGGATVQAAVLDVPDHAAHVEAALDGMSAACAGSTGAAGLIAAADQDGWRGVTVTADDGTIQRVHWLAGDATLAIVATDDDLQPASLATVLRVQRALLEDPPAADPWPADCAASLPWAEGEPHLAADPASLCAADGGPWIVAPNAIVERVSGARDGTCRADSTTSSAVSAELLVALLDDTSTVRLGDRPAYGGTVVVAVLDDAAAADAAAVAFDAGLACVGTTLESGVAWDQSVAAVPTVDGWTSLAITERPRADGYPEGTAVVQHWAVIDGAFVLVQVPADLDAAATQTLLDVQRERLSA
ncbi:hypothetical protein [Agrococcus jejuensis]|uniref:PknH-like extracellular domain-containing protein n=1 Tax=Agrococcus jejuensis TaxID=399736 RepID=A0A1G8A485_9MICO|nr:hypothetical protein [Agrococcus jejuensis]SDH15667.1 hypothetical protein SAMN04489720_0239 [Agrococcus jejuensis]